jgi:hypothetical protein
MTIDAGIFRPVLAAHYRVIAVSLRHYFPEPWDGQGDDFSVLQHADDVAEFSRVLDLGPVHCSAIRAEARSCSTSLPVIPR